MGTGRGRLNELQPEGRQREAATARLMLALHGAVHRGCSMSILCATRFSEESSPAVDAAAALARAHREPLELIHVAPSGLLRAFADRFNEVAATALKAEAARLTKEGTTVVTRQLSGRLEEVLAAHAAKVGARAVVVGDTVERGTSMLASTLDKLALALSVPLLIVRDARPFSAWARGDAQLKVLLAMDKTTSAAVARDWVAQLAKFGPIELVATSIFWPLREYERRGLPVPPPEEGHLTIVNTVKAELTAALTGLPSNVTTRVRLEMGLGHTAEQLVEVANDEQVDLVLLGTHRRTALSRLWSVSHHVMLQAPMAVACVPSTTAVAHVSAPPRFKSLLVLTDLSEASSRAIAYAAAAVGPSGLVHVAHVAPEPLSPEQERTLMLRLMETLPMLAQRAGPRLVAHILQGEVEAVGPEAAARLDVDGFCVGAVPLSLAERARVGVVAPSVLAQWRLLQALMERAQRPVLVAPPLPT